MKTGERLYLRFLPSQPGTVSRVTPMGFTVTYDFPARKRGEPRLRFTYPRSAEQRFARVGEEES